jgi:hypothetical protein
MPDRNNRILLVSVMMGSCWGLEQSIPFERRASLKPIGYSWSLFGMQIRTLSPYLAVMVQEVVSGSRPPHRISALQTGT